jgi:hypothetical protein
LLAITGARKVDFGEVEKGEGKGGREEREGKRRGEVNEVRRKGGDRGKA